VDDKISQFGSPLTPADYQNLERSFISREIADSAFLRRVTSEEGKQVVGRRNHEDYSGIIFPNILPGQAGCRSHRLRRDNPPVEIKNGLRKERDKYLSPPGYGNMLYFHPLTDPRTLVDPRTPIVILEGEKKTLAMYRLISEAGTEQDIGRIVPIGLSGVYGWSGTVGKTENSNGRRVSEKGPIPDLARVEWRGRTVYILFDADTHTNPKIASARNRLAQELVSRDAEIRLINLPQDEGINGIDDFLGHYGADFGIKLFGTAHLFDPKEKLARLHYTDHGNEQAFEIMFDGEYLYNWTERRWLHWTGVYWKADETFAVDRAMLEVAAARLQATSLLSEEAGQTAGQLNKKKAVAEALRLESIRGRYAALESVKSNPRFARTAEDFDNNPYLVACGNGVLELRTGKFRAGCREELITRATSVCWVPEAKYDLWLGFLEGVFPNRPDVIRFLKRAIGYSLTGLTREEVLFILYGSGRNGKGTFLRVLSAMLGDYAHTTEFSTLIADRDRSRSPRNDIAALAGRRFVTAQESREGARLDESLIKTLTGGDLITARFLHQEFFTFKPTWKLWLATNHKPIIRGSDSGIWSRPKLIPFTVSFEGRENRQLKDQLLQPLELSGILNWAVDGCREYLADGLGYPQEIMEATATYRAESDLIERFLEDACVRSGSARVRARALYQAYSAWVEGAGESKISETAFGLRMREKGFEKKVTEHGNVYLAVGLKDESHTG
jgi:putative DNA primase/helicase